MNNQLKNLVASGCQVMKQWGVYFEWQEVGNGFAKSVGLGKFFSEGELAQNGGSSYITGDETDMRSVFQNAQVGKGKLSFICLLDNGGGTVEKKTVEKKQA